MSTTEDRNGDAVVYELGYLVLPSIPEEGLSSVVSTIKEIISKKGGKEIFSEMPFKKNLAYAMSKTVGASKYVVTDAYIGWIKFELSVDLETGDEHPVEAIKKEVEKMNEILRILLIKAPRETTFTFAQALAAKEKEEGDAVEEPSEEASAVVE